MNVPALHWFALPGGRYWTVEHGRSDATLSDRPYFPSVLAGRTVIGELATSRSTNRNTAIVAVPVRGRTGAVVGVLGASVHLDSLSAIVRGELGGLGDALIFFAIDSKPLGALHYDTTMIFTDPMKLGDEEMRGAFRQMLAADEGTVTYPFRGSRRTIVFVRSPLTGWRYALGVSGGAASEAHGSADGRIPARLPPALTGRRQWAGAPPMAPVTRGAAGGSPPPNKPGP
jgi:methyl-accepting chemotaxis protein